MNSLKPDSAQVVTTYGELDRYVGSFADGHFGLLIVIGRPGLQKSRLVKAALRGPACWIDGNATAFRVYCELYQHRDRTVVVDDVDSLYEDRAAVRLLKCVCQSEPVKRVAWHSSAAQLRREGIPRAFETTSRVVIIANRWKTLNENVAAVEDRGHVLLFDPAACEVHRRVAEWFWDQKIYDFVAERLHLFASLSMRDYHKAAELKMAGMNWRRYLLGRCDTDERTRLVAELLIEDSFTSEEDRVLAFTQQTGCCRATYFNCKKKLKPKIRVPHVELNNPPPAPSQPAADLLSLLRRRHRWLGRG